MIQSWVEWVDGMWSKWKCSEMFTLPMFRCLRPTSRNWIHGPWSHSAKRSKSFESCWVKPSKVRLSSVFGFSLHSTSCRHLQSVTKMKRKVRDSWKDFSWKISSEIRREMKEDLSTLTSAALASAARVERQMRLDREDFQSSNSRSNAIQNAWVSDQG